MTPLKALALIGMILGLVLVLCALVAGMGIGVGAFVKWVG
jgi:hypothetical protein